MYLAQTEVERVVKKTLVVGPHVEDDGDGCLGVDTGAEGKDGITCLSDNVVDGGRQAESSEQLTRRRRVKACR